MKLNEYFEKNCINIPAFAKKHGIASSIIYKILQGADTRLSTALKIEEATGRKVTCRELAPTKKSKNCS